MREGEVLPLLKRGVVTLRRRGGADVELMTRGQREALGTMVRVLAEVAMGGEERAAGVLPWLALLGEDDQRVCLRELTEIARAAVDTGRLDRLEEALYAWRATGLAEWDERRARERCTRAGRS